jgi:hypothetical protein
MRNDPLHPDPSPEQLAAFLDGEVDPAGRARVEAWLATHPDAAGEMEGQRRLLRVWADNPPPEPDAAKWAAARGRIEARLSRPAGRRRRLPLWLGLGAAAALAAAALLTRFLLPGAPPTNQKTGPATIVKPRDAGPPQPDLPILLASQDDVSVMSMEPYADDDGRVPQIGEGDVPMIVAPSLARPGTP